MPLDEGLTRQLLNRWNAGEQQALGLLLERHLDWITDYVHGRLGGQLRARAETMDFVQQSFADFLNYGPRFEVADESAFRGLLARVAENNIRDQQRHFGRQKRDVRRTENVDSLTVLRLDAQASVTRPSQHAQRDESAAMVRVALELLAPQDREVILLREFDELSFAEVGMRMNIAEDAARMRFARALPKLAEKIVQLRERGLAGALEEPAANAPAAKQLDNPRP